MKSNKKRHSIAKFSFFAVNIGLMNYLRWFSAIRANFVFFKNWRQHNIFMNRSGERLYIEINFRRAKWLTIHSYHLHRRKFTSRLQSFNSNLDLYFPKWKNRLRRFQHNYGGAYIKNFPTWTKNQRVPKLQAIPVALILLWLIRSVSKTHVVINQGGQISTKWLFLSFKV